MLELASVSWKNFLSFGNYVSSIPLDNLGQCLITGDVQESGSKIAYDNAPPLGAIRRSNGAGKSTCTTILQWILFGRTMHTATPGDEVINWFTGKDCWGQLMFKNGDTITRTRNTNGYDELLLQRGGSESKFAATTLSIAKNQQKELNKMFGLDWELFCGSTFFSQYGLPWLEMHDQTRKKALERLLRVDRFTYYGNVAKAKTDILNTEIEKLNNKKNLALQEIERLTIEIARLQELSSNFHSRQHERSIHTRNTAKAEADKRDALELPDLEKLKKKWEIITKVGQQISVQQTKADMIRRQIDQLNSEKIKARSHISTIENKIKLWKNLKGKVCTACEQDIPHEHVNNKIEPFETELERHQQDLTVIEGKQKELQITYNNINTSIETAHAALAQKKPSVTVRDAESIHNKWQQCNAESTRLEVLAGMIIQEENPHEGALLSIQETIKKHQEQIEKLDETIVRQDMLSKHYSYVYKAYTDRNKLKSVVFREHIPFINDRLKHYLDAFGLDVTIQLTDSLGLSSDKWKYTFESGGERKRTDVAFMLAIFDFHEHMYGRQSNVLVLDEVDGRLDEDGIDSLINIIKTELVFRVETIFIVSHRNQMQDVFPREVRVVRRNRFSSLSII